MKRIDLWVGVYEQTAGYCWRLYGVKTCEQADRWTLCPDCQNKSSHRKLCVLLQWWLKVMCLQLFSFMVFPILWKRAWHRCCGKNTWTLRRCDTESVFLTGMTGRVTQTVQITAIMSVVYNVKVCFLCVCSEELKIGFLKKLQSSIYTDQIVYSNDI